MKLKLSTKFGYGMGDLFGGGALTIIAFYYLYFLTDIIGINPALAGIAFLVSKVWDAVSDPLMGLISDRTNTRFGRRRPYFIAGSIFIFLSYFLMWYPVDFAEEMHRFIYILAAYLFFSTVFTMVMVPYNALPAELSDDYNDRTSLATFRMVFSNIASILAALVPLELVKLFEDVHQGYVFMALIFGLFFSLPFIITFYTCKERKDFMEESSGLSLKSIIRNNFILPMKIKSFRKVLSMYLFGFIAQDGLMAIVIYFMTYYLGKKDLMFLVLVIIHAVLLVSIVIVNFISKRIGKKKTYSISVLAWIGACFYSLFLGPVSPLPLIIIFCAVLGFALAGIQVMVFAMFPDIPDVDELISGKRREGVYSGLFSFMRKMGAALAMFFISNSIHWAGYNAPVKETVNGVTKLIEQQQSEEFIFVLRILFAILPIVLLCFCLYNSITYPLTSKLHEKLRIFLARRREHGIVDNDMQMEEDELRKALV